ncbi:MAG: hypothetical protein HKP48_11480 [Winogradskyella sp.]|uniref:hypothetical protein n=1 Tax=Winogradskyella sp. TaxID=1883156 RepID=UPI00183186A4|nr:hypothetical protein [Winogradskyella sp.]MBT8244704.1 hypothetical protein [Winogradskyella sp.]NNK23879.1 hypothetical protein [Winogradskyella sp.]
MNKLSNNHRYPSNSSHYTTFNHPYKLVTQHLKNVTKNNLELNLKEATSSLLEMVRNSCWNKISDNTSYIISEIINDERNFFDKRIERKKANEKKNPKSLEQITAELNPFYALENPLLME